MTRDEMVRRVAELNEEIAAYPYWGAALSVMDEERRALERALRALKPPVGGQK